jgi:hypothetical protein
MFGKHSFLLPIGWPWEIGGQRSTEEAYLNYTPFLLQWCGEKCDAVVPAACCRLKGLPTFQKLATLFLPCPLKSLARDGQEYFAGVQYRPLTVSVSL